MYEEERDGGKMRKYKRKERQRKRKWTLCNHPSSQISSRSTSVQSGVVMGLSDILHVLFVEHGGSDRLLRVVELGEKRAK